MSTGLFVQIRLGSTRLPRKALLPLPGGCLIQHVMRALAGVRADRRALLTDEASRKALASLAEEEGFELFVGPEEDVLGRYCMAARAYGVSRVIRATGDNPLTSARLAAGILSAHEEAHADLSHYLGVPWGSGVEVVEATALFAAEKAAMQRDEREHITTYLYRHRDLFSIHEPAAPTWADCPSCRVTVDTPEDLEMIRGLFAELYDGHPIEIEPAIAWLRARQREQSHA